jgi:hypothetical protein
VVFARKIRSLAGELKKTGDGRGFLLTCGSALDILAQQVYPMLSHTDRSYADPFTAKGDGLTNQQCGDILAVQVYHRIADSPLAKIG